MTEHQVPVWADLSVPEETLDPQGLSRRSALDTWRYTNPVFVDVGR